MNKVYLLDAKHISAQKPLSEEWTDAPIYPSGSLSSFTPSIDPDYAQCFAPNVRRRLGKLLKRALLASRTVMESSGIACPDAILTGTGFGCVENTEVFLEAMTFEGEDCLKPTNFMQSTHNTIGSLIAIETGCHGYNTTYTHKGVSFESALLDAFIRIANGHIRNALVGSYDEMTPHYRILLNRTDYPGNAYFGSETALSAILADEPSEGSKALCRIEAIEMIYGKSPQCIATALQRILCRAGRSFSDLDAIMTGLNADKANDAVYRRAEAELFSGKPLLQYKHLFGESHAVSGLGVYATAVCLQRGSVPGFMLVSDKKFRVDKLRDDLPAKTILFYNHCGGKNHALILMSSCE
ncbi:MAG: beta-ketoacyl synthase chain length factor [Tannerellaceae bacterium]|jgi:3-oxoacyl-(acyl-carrier-protein) synthase|nr:beta-ketoacyl synthase chain length factor [Tannerellaceae bacterium]